MANVDSIENARDFVRSIVWKYVRNKHDVDDVVQDALLAAHRYRETFRGDAQYSSWIYRVAVTTALNYIRSKKRAAEDASANAAQLERLPGALDLEGDAIARAELARAQESLRGSVGEQMYWEYTAEGMSEREIAAKHGLTMPAVKARIHRARQRVHASLSAA